MDTQLLIKRAQNGDKEAREQLINENVGLVWSIVRRYMGRGQEAEDLFQIGVIGLMKAVDKFDLSYEVMFSTYAVPMISGEMKRYLRDNNSLIKMSRSIKENGWKIKQAKERLAYELGRDATMEELAAATELSMEDVVTALEANSEIESIYKTVYQGDGNEIYLVDRIREEKNETETLLNRMTVEALLDSLTESEKLLIVSRYFEDKTQTETAKLLGISQVQVSRLEKKILLKMRKNVQG
ncbi:MAG: SigB/SigF/SigG family RNA polymerase sigma factor [Lachnospiraceae bacterium]|nr:SigB/SigF/SigG family RNA polymerase sigma factor [Lachnospiraceae bacterium]